jgi:hypothetical protein
LGRQDFSSCLSGQFSARQAQMKEVREKKIWIFPIGLEVHLLQHFSYLFDASQDFKTMQVYM